MILTRYCFLKGYHHLTTHQPVRAHLFHCGGVLEFAHFCPQTSTWVRLFPRASVPAPFSMCLDTISYQRPNCRGSEVTCHSPFPSKIFIRKLTSKEVQQAWALRGPRGGNCRVLLRMFCSWQLLCLQCWHDARVCRVIVALGKRRGFHPLLTVWRGKAVCVVVKSVHAEASLPEFEDWFSCFLAV